MAATNNDPGQTMKLALQNLLASLQKEEPSQRKVDERDWQAVNRCFARGNEAEYEGHLVEAMWTCQNGENPSEAILKKVLTEAAALVAKL